MKLEPTEDLSQPKDLVRSLLDPSPSLEFSLERWKGPGQKEAYKFRSRLLRSEQKNDAMAAAREYYCKKTKTKEVDESSQLFHEAYAQEILQRATVHSEIAENPDGTKVWKHVFVSADQLRQSLDTPEQVQLLRAHYATEQYYGFSSFDESKIEEFIDTLSNNLTGTYFLSQLDSADLPRLIFSLARLAVSWRQEALQTQSSSESSLESDQSSSESGTIGSLPRLSELSIGLEIPDSNEAPTRAEAHDIVLAHDGSVKE